MWTTDSVKKKQIILYKWPTWTLSFYNPYKKRNGPEQSSASIPFLSILDESGSGLQGVRIETVRKDIQRETEKETKTDWHDDI